MVRFGRTDACIRNLMYDHLPSQVPNFGTDPGVPVFQPLDRSPTSRGSCPRGMLAAAESCPAPGQIELPSLVYASCFPCPPTCCLPKRQYVVSPLQSFKFHSRAVLPVRCLLLPFGANWCRGTLRLSSSRTAFSASPLSWPEVSVGIIWYCDG